MRFLVIFLLLVLHAMPVAGEEFTLIIQTKTGNKNNAGTNEPVYFALHYLGTREIPRKNPKREPRVVPDAKRIEKPLDNKGDDRKTGAVDEYRLKFDCPINKIQGVEIGLKSGDDAWYLEGFRYVIETKDKASDPVNVPCTHWLSAARGDGPKSQPATQYLTLEVKPPKMKAKPPAEPTNSAATK